MNLDCSICGISHEPMLHEAIASLRAWFREQVVLGLKSVKEPPAAYVGPVTNGLAGRRPSANPDKQHKGGRRRTNDHFPSGCVANPRIP